MLFIINIEFPSKILFNFSNILSFAKFISSNKIHSSFFIAWRRIPSKYLKLFFLFPFLFNCCINLFNSLINISISLITLLLLLLLIWFILSFNFFREPIANFTKYNSFWILDTLVKESYALYKLCINVWFFSELKYSDKIFKILSKYFFKKFLVDTGLNPPNKSPSSELWLIFITFNLIFINFDKFWIIRVFPTPVSPTNNILLLLRINSFINFM